MDRSPLNFFFFGDLKILYKKDLELLLYIYRSRDKEVLSKDTFISQFSIYNVQKYVQSFDKRVFHNSYILEQGLPIYESLESSVRVRSLSESQCRGSPTSVTPQKLIVHHLWVVYKRLSYRITQGESTGENDKGSSFLTDHSSRSRQVF